MQVSDRVLHAVLGTAGHIDHGKSSLVRALTGTDPDRFREEQERGMTIDIGFAEYRTPSGVDVGLIDVPGHEKFIRNMVAGAMGMDVVMLVVAADDSVMPQTREHLEIMDLLGIERGFVVLTKVDMVDDEMIELVEEELSEFLEGTFLAGTPIIRCSSITGFGIDAVKDEIHRLVDALPPRDRGGVFRMPVQRSFTLKGHGTVVTGVPVSGEVKIGDVLEVLPRGESCRVRGLHVHHQAAESSGAGNRTAINLSDVNYKDIQRGDVVASPGFFTPSRMVEARFRLLPSIKQALRNNRPIRFHVGCTEAMGRLIILDSKSLEPGTDALVQIRLEDPVVVAPGDRYIVRLASPARTLGGGVVLGETRYRFKRFRDWITENIEGKEESLGDRLHYLEYVVRSEGLHPVNVDKLPLMAKQSVDEVRTQLDELRAAGRIVDLDGTKEVLHTDMVDRGVEVLEKDLMALHEADHYPFGFPLQAIASRMQHGLPATRVFVARALQKNRLEVQGGLHRLKAFKGNLSREDRRLLGTIEERIQSTRFATPLTADIAKEMGKPIKRVENILTLLEGWGRVVKIADNVFLHIDAMREARDLLVAYCLEHGEMPSNQMKDVIGATRKYVIPLLEHFDAIGLTRREDSSRKLEPGYEKVLVSEEAESPG